MKFSDLPKHHAVLIEHTERDSIGDSLFLELQQLSHVHTFFNQKVLDIDTARKIISWALAPYNEEKIALISFHTIGLEAQNALLKMLEEPRDGVRFILLTSNKANLIDTVLSRVFLVGYNKTTEATQEAETFLKTSCSSRMKLPYIVDIISRTEKENGKERKDREPVYLFILTLVTVLKNKKNAQKYVEETLKVASYAADSSSSGKALLEYLSLLLPQSKV
jgi:DNA polymerase-3 subunit delta'